MAHGVGQKDGGAQSHISRSTLPPGPAPARLGLGRLEVLGAQEKQSRWRRWEMRCDSRVRCARARGKAGLTCTRRPRPAQAPCALPAVDSRPRCPGGVHPRHPARGRPLRVPELARRGPPLTPAVGRAGAGRGGAAEVPAHPAGAREPGRNPTAGPERPAARRRQWERRWLRRWRWRSPGPGGDGRPRHEPRSRAPPCAARGPRRAASASPGPRPGAGDVLPGLRMMVDCQVSAPPGRDRPPHRQGVEEGPRARPRLHPIQPGRSTAPSPR